MAVRTKDAIAAARALIGTPYSELDCIGLIVRVIRTTPGGKADYRTAGTNTLWRSAEASAKYRDLTWRQEGISGALAGMLAFKRSGDNVHHVGLVTERGTVIHSSSAKGCVVETALDDTWQLLAVHRYIEVTDETQAAAQEEMEGAKMEPYKMRVVASSLNVRNEPGVGGTRIGRIGQGAVVTVQDEMENGWKYITYGDGALGYVDGSYLGSYEEPAAAEAPKITIIDSANNHFVPVGDFRVIVGSVD